MNTDEILLASLSVGVTFWLDGDRLAYRAPKGAMTKALRDAIILRKAELIAHLRERPAPPPSEPARKSPFRDLVAQARLGVSRQEHEAFFRRMLADVDEPTAPFGVLDTASSGANAEARLDVTGAVYERLRLGARRLGTTPATVCHVAWAQVLARLTGRERVVFGTVLLGRMHGGEGIDRGVGLFVNTLPVAIDIGAATVDASVRDAHARLAELMKHEHAPLALAQRCSGVAAPRPLFTSLLNYRHGVDAAPAGAQPWRGIEVLHSDRRSNYPLSITVDDLGDTLAVSAQVEASIDAGRVCAMMHAALERLGEAMASSPATAVATLDVLPAAERTLVVETWNRTERAIPSASVPEVFAAHVAATPEAVAVVHGDRALTYAELDARANGLASHLRSLGVGSESRVAIAGERSVELVIGMLAVLKAGGAYVPLDGSAPVERLRGIVEDAEAVAVLSQGELADGIAGDRPVVDLSREWPLDAGTLAAVAPSDLAYVIYTSGSTGKPKGVMVEHRSIVRLVIEGGYASFGAESRVAFAANPAFDAATMEVWGPLLNGGTVVVVEQEELLEPRRFGTVLRRHEVNTLWMTVGLFNRYAGELVEEIASLEYLIVGGDALEPRAIARTLKRGRPRHLVNGYGPTETTTFAVTHEIVSVPEGAKGIPIGRPIGNTRVYILDGQGRPSPVGAIGELYIGGLGVARGYLGRPELTAERFVADRFRGEGCLYRTGDLGRWLADGTIEFMGRNDGQVKIRGFRVELGEIEAQLLTHPAVREAVVVVREGGEGGKRLIAYVSLRGDIAVEDLRAHLSSQLPEYMVPAALVRLDALPLTVNGKVDRRALPAPEEGAYATQAYEAPEGETEIAIAALWSQLLGVVQIGRRDDFFALGGHSLLAVTLVERLRQHGLHADVRTVFGAPTLAGLAAAVSGTDSAVTVPPNLIPEGCTAIAPEMLPLVELTQDEIDRVVATVPGGAANVQDIYPLAPLQEGILFHHLMAESGDAYLLSSQMAFDTRRRLDAFLGALQVVVDRHDILRTSVAWEGLAEPVQVVWRHAPLRVETVDLDPHRDACAQLRERFDPRRFRLDVRQAPLVLVACAFDATHQRWLVHVLWHHLVGDHTTLEVIGEEVQAVLTGQSERLAESVPFRALVAQARLGASRDEHERFFRGMLADIDQPTAPFDLLDVQGDGGGVSEAHVEIDPPVVRRLRDQARRLGVTAASLCHLAWAQVLARITGRRDVVFGTVLFGRLQGSSGANRAIGPFINTLPVRMAVGDEGGESSARRMHALLAELMRHEHASLALAQRCSAVPASMPLFTSLLNYRHTGGGGTRDDARGEGIELLHSEERTNYPLTLSVDDLGEGLGLTALVQASIDPERVCALMATALERLVEALESTPGLAVRSLDVLPPAERTLVIETWNETAAEVPAVCLHQLFEAQVARTPEAIALEHGGVKVTYAELDARANGLAHRLRALGVVADSRVAICAERGVEMVVGMLAVLKAGGAYVPLDPAYPVDRLRTMVADCDPVAVLVHGTRIDEIVESASPAPSPTGGGLGWGRAVVQLGASWDDTSPLSVAVSPSDLAYVIYTSGSSGVPKGVMIEHRNAVNFVAWARTAFEARALTRTVFATSINFDLAVYELFVPLSVGATVVLVQDALTLATEEVKGTLINTVPSAMGMLVSAGRVPASVRTVNLAGEALKRELVERIFATTQAERVCNLYGPSETTTYSTWVSMSREGGFDASIGGPIANTQIYILDEDGRPCPIGVTGELYIGGAGVARGYLNRAELTAERFVEDPHRPGARMYRTGDVGRWRPDGRIAFLGRNDQQVKIRGYRIELGEIESRLAEHVREAVVVAREDGTGERRLVAYIVSADSEIESLRRQLATQLPEYMIPSAFVRLESLPLTPNGKVDRKALPSPEGEAYATRGYEAPIGDVETTLAALWSEALGVERVGRHDNFFELGGHSLRAVGLVERMRRAGLHTDVRALFAAPTLAGLAATLGGERPELVVPPNGIPSHAAAITPDMLPLIALTQDEIDRIAATVPGGASNVQDIYPLAPLQEGILFHHVAASQGDAYVLSSQLAFDTRERLDAFLGALQSVMDRHDVLRTAVLWEGLPEPVQVVWRRASLPIERCELPEGDDAAAQLRERFASRRYRMDVRRAPLLRVCVAADPKNDRWLLLLLLHHLAGDHAALDVLRDEVQAHLLGAAGALAPSVPFRALVARARLGIRRDEHEAYFRGQLGDIDEPTAPFDLLDVHGDGEGMDEAHAAVDAEVAQRLRERARALGVTTASLCHLAWAQVLARLTGRRDVVFGTVLFGRLQGDEGVASGVGPFINTLPVRISIDDGRVEDCARRTHAALVDLMRHEHATLALAQRCSAVAASRPLFTTLFNYRHSAVGFGPSGTAQAWQGIELLAAEERTNYPLTLAIDDVADGFRITAKVHASIAASRLCDLMHTALAELASHLDRAPATPTQRIDVLPERERRIVETWNATAEPYPAHACIHDLFEAQVARTPDAIAILHGDRTLRYSELNARANRLAHRLRALGVGPDGRVAICADRGVEMVIGVLSILKAGGAYVPLDPAYPADRLRAMIADSQPVAILVQGWRDEGIAGTVPMIDLEAPLAGEPDDNLDRAGLGAEHPAYVIYTSGSTGRPKGVQVLHRGVVNFLSTMVRRPGFGPDDRLLAVTTLSFDVSVRELFLPITVGGTIVMANRDDAIDGARLQRLIESAGVTVMCGTPARWRLLLDAGWTGSPTLRKILCGGEALPPSLVQELIPRVPEIWNMYGPTETTVCATCMRVVDPGDVTIGTPIGNARVYVLDELGRPAPIGVAGELHIGGAGVARGYLHRPELTAERFVRDPFSSDAGARMFRTGDFARRRADGMLEFLGRKDGQVKIRGFRIELGEIEAVLQTHPDVHAVVVIAREDTPGDRRLVAYTTSDAPIAADALRDHAARQLPDYMVPAAFVHIERLPLTPNGKLDRKALPAPEGDAFASRAYEAPIGPTETAVASIWAGVLGVPRVGRNDNFFELGGHSLMAVTLIERMRQAGVATDVRTLFASPTVASLVAAAAPDPGLEVPQNRIPEGCTAIVPDMLPLVDLTPEEIARVVATVPGGAANLQDIYPLAPLQEGILFHHLLAREGDAYLLSHQLAFDTRDRLDAFVAALQAVVDRHDILRTAVVWEGVPEPVQVVWRSAPVPIEEVVMEPGADPGEVLRARFDPRWHRLDLRQAPMLRGYIARDATRDRWLLTVLLHHFIDDNTSLQGLLAEIHARLNGATDGLPPSRPFRDLVAQARRGASRQEHEAFFVRMLGDIDEPTAPFGVLDVQGDGEMAEQQIAVDAAVAARLRQRARALGVTPASLCHLAWAQVLARLTGRDRVVFGTVLFGRTHSQAHAGMGPFINTLPVAIDIGDDAVGIRAREVHARLAELMRHEHASLALAQRASGVAPSTPLFTSLFNYRHGMNATAETPPEWNGVEVVHSARRTNYPVTVSVDDFGTGLWLTAQVEASIDAGRVCAMMHTALERLVEALESSPTTPVRALDVLPSAERTLVVETWNRTERAIPSASVSEVFEARVAATPEAVAVVHGERVLTYAELDARASGLARHLRSLGVGSESRVAIAGERSAELVIGMLAVLKAGGAYVPLDGAAPVERLRGMVEDAEAVAVLSQGELADGIAGDRPVVDLSREWPVDVSATVAVAPRDLAYVIYTSGSTGAPKGVMVEHRSIVRLVIEGGYASFGPWSRVAFAANPAFDAATMEVWGPLLNGGSVVVVEQEELLEARRFGAALRRHGVNTLWMTVGLFNRYADELVEEIASLEYLIVGGDALEPRAIARTLSRGGPRHLVNGYGPTETTTFAVTHEIESVPEGAKSIPIGRPIGNTQVYLLDRHGREVPVGAIGELYIGGLGVARGYLGREDLTAERFVADRFRGEGRLYRTGDLGRWLVDGTIEFVGRNDGQVKIRGFRVELGEIESRLLTHPGVREAVVVAREGEGGKRLIAYVTSGSDVAVEELRAHLSSQLPEYMVPAAFVRLDALPLTANGKVDRRALPAPEEGAYATQVYEPPMGDTEIAIAALWSQLLGVAQIGRRDDFFALGGHSLLAVTLVERMRQQGLHADVRTVFGAPTLAGLAAAVRETDSAVTVPPNLIPDGSTSIAPEMLPLVELTQDEIDRVVATVPGGAANVQDIYPLAPLQEGILFHHLMAQEGDAYLLSSFIAFDTRAQLDAFVHALHRVVARHDILRTSVAWEGLAEPVQVVWRDAPVPVEELALPAGSDAELALRERFDPRRTRLDLRHAPMLRVCITFDAPRGRWLLALTWHHLLGDHTTLSVIGEEVQAYLLGREGDLPASIPFRTLVAQARLGVGRDEHVAFFRRMLGDVDQTTAPFGLLDVQGDGAGIAEARVLLDEKVSRQLREQARRLGVTAASLCHQAWAQVLARLTGRRDVVFGTVLLGRMQGGSGSDRALGPFINTLPMRIVVGDDDVPTSVRRTHALLAELMRHEHAPLALAQRCSAVPAPMPLFTSLLNYRHAQHADLPAETVQALSGMTLLQGEERTNYPLTLSVDDLGEGLGLTALVQASIDPERVCALMATALERLVEALESTPGTSVRSLDVLPPAERTLVIETWNETAADVPAVCLHELVEAQAERTPEAIALEHGDVKVTYAELDARANGLAHRLCALGVVADSRVAICAERGVEMVVGMLGVLKAGGAYVPLDPAYPVDRLRAMVADCDPVAVLVHGTRVEGIVESAPPPQPSPGGGGGWGRAVVDLGASWGDTPLLPPLSVSPSGLAYVIYTSGSSGVPKGVMIEHRNAVNFVAWARTAFEARALTRTVFATSINFDLAVYELFVPLSMGATVVLVQDALTLATEAVDGTLINTVPSAMGMLVSAGRVPGSVRTVNLAGEALKRELVERIFATTQAERVCNLYGPSETTTYSTWVSMSREGGFDASIGGPIANTQIYILDEDGRPCPIGVTGELYIGGAGVARGYLNRAELTAERFAADPYRSGSRMYRTGDVGRWRPDGRIEFLGRNDQQVKIRGFRIELGEIESRLVGHPEVREAVVVAREDAAGERRIVAYVATSADTEIESLRRHLATQLPEYMIPSAFVRLESLPLTPNGKVDRKALPSPEGEAYVTRGYEAPIGDVETTLAALWCEALGVARVGRHDNFFELGGHSLRAVGLIERMRRAGLHADVRALFAAPTIAGIALAVADAATQVVVPDNLIPDASPREDAGADPAADDDEVEIEL